MFFALSGNSGVGHVSLGKEAPWCFDRPVNETPLGWEWLSKVRMVGTVVGVWFLFTIF